MADLDISDADKDRRTGLLEYTSLDEVDNLVGERANFYSKMATVLKCNESELQIESTFKKHTVTKDMLASFLATACKLLEDQERMIENFQELRSLEHWNSQKLYPRKEVLSNCKQNYCNVKKIS